MAKADNNAEPIDVEVTMLHQTAAAWKWESWVTNKIGWVPRSQATIEWVDEGQGHAVMLVPAWLATEKGLI